jgi:hypothetical protein
MSNPRASIFEDDGDLDVSGFTPKTEVDRSGPPADAVRAIAEAANFRRRDVPAEQGVAPPQRAHRRHRTGRNVQFNIKATQEAIDAFVTVSDEQGWVFGETLERAVAALKREMLEGK